MSWSILTSSSAWAEGGDSTYTVVVSGVTYRVHEFRTVGTQTLNVMNGGNIEYLIVAGGSGTSGQGNPGGSSSTTYAIGGGGGGVKSPGGSAGVSTPVSANTGNGGGYGISGASGIVIVRYAI